MKPSLIALLSAVIFSALFTFMFRPAHVHVDARDTAFARMTKTKTLRCAYIPYPPYFDMDAATHQPKGLVVDIMESVARKLDVKLEWSEEVGWGTMIEGLETGRYDAVCTGAWAIPARALHADFSMPILYNPVYAWVRIGDDRFDGPNAINAASTRMAVIDGEANQALSRELFPLAVPVSVPQTAPYSDVFVNIVTNKADVVVAEPKTVEDFLKTNPGTLKRVGAAIITYPMAIVLPKGDAALKSALDAALGEIVYTSVLDSALKKYGLETSALPPQVPYRR